MIQLRMVPAAGSQAGFTLVEAIVSAGLLAMVALASASLLVAMGQAAAGAKGISYADLLVSNIRSNLLTVTGFAQTKSHSADLQTCSNPDWTSGLACDMTTTYAGGTGVDIYNQAGEIIAGGSAATPVLRYTRGLVDCTALGAATPDCPYEASATFTPICPNCGTNPGCGTNKCARAEIINFQITVRQNNTIRVPGPVMRTVVANIPVKLSVVAEKVFPGGSSPWVAPPGITSVNAILIGGGAGGGDTSYNIAGFTWVSGPGGASGSARIDTFAVVPGTAYTVTAGGGGAAGGNGGMSSFTGGAYTAALPCTGTNMCAGGGKSNQGSFTGTCLDTNNVCNLGGKGFCNDCVAGGPYPASPGEWIQLLHTVNASYPDKADFHFNGVQPFGGHSIDNSSGGGGAGFAPFYPAVPYPTVAFDNTMGYPGKFAGAGGGGGADLAHASPGASGYVRLRW